VGRNGHGEDGLEQYRDIAAVIIGRRVFDLTGGWDGVPAAGEHVFVVTHRPPTDWEYADTAPFTFVDVSSCDSGSSTRSS